MLYYTIPYYPILTLPGRPCRPALSSAVRVVVVAEAVGRVLHMYICVYTYVYVHIYVYV